MKSSAASSSASGGTGNSRSAATRRGARLVTITFSPGELSSRRAMLPAAGNTCSKLSMRRSNSVPFSSRISSSSGFGPTSGIPSASRIAPATSVGSRRVAIEATADPCRNSGARRRTSSSASRVLPMPPVPISVTSRASSSRTNSARAASSRSRPRSGVGGVGARRGDVGPACGTFRAGSWARIARSS